MSLTDVMEDVDYKRKNFNLNEAQNRHPLWITERHYVYLLSRDAHGHLTCNRDIKEQLLCSPRQLKQICMQKVVINPIRMQKFRSHELPFDLYPPLLTEAILQRELQTITFLVSTWPHTVLDIQSIIPLEDILRPDYLTVPVEGQGSMSLVDSIIMGLLTLKPHAKLKVANFIGFKTDRKLCRELARLPILWMNPSDRQAGYIHSLLRRTLYISKDKVQRYLNRIGCIYSLIDPCIRHGNKVGPVTILMDCKVTLDDVPIGLVLQYETPFRYACNRLWMEPIAEVLLPIKAINAVLDSRHITHLEIKDENLCAELSKFDSFLEGLLLLVGLRTLSMPNTLHVNVHSNAVYEVSEVLKHLKLLQKLNLSSCNIRDNLDLLLKSLCQPLVYLNLRDCRLSKTDIQCLLQWESLAMLKELNLSRNNLKTLAHLSVALIHRMPKITCFSLSYCCFSVIGLHQIILRCMECSRLKLLGIQGFTPPPLPDIKIMLENCSHIPTLQKCIILPEAFAFPGSNELGRIKNRDTIIGICCQFLDHLGRPDIELD